MRRLLLIPALVLAGCVGTRSSPQPIQLALTYLTVDSPQAVRDSVVAWASAQQGVETITDGGLAIRDTRPGSSGLTTVDLTARIDGLTEVRVGTEYMAGDGSGRPVAVEWLSRVGVVTSPSLVLPADGSLPTCYSVEDWKRDVEQQSAAVPRTRAPDEEIDEREPELIGGMGVISQRLRYPEPLRKAGVEGPVVVQFVVNEDGAVDCVESILSPHPQLSAAAEEAVQTLAFRPGMQRGVPVRVRFTLPVTFRLR